MTKEQMQERKAAMEQQMKQLQEQFAAQMNFMAGQIALLDELLKPEPEPAEV